MLILTRLWRRAATRGLALAILTLWITASVATAQPNETADSLFGWAGALGPATASFADVAYDGTQRVYAGYLYDSMSLTLTATLFSTTQAPGGTIDSHDLGFSVDPSVAVSVAPGDPGRYWVAVSQNDGVTATTAHRIDWSAGAGSTTLQLTGPPTVYDPFVTVRDVNENGDTVGQLADVRGLVHSTLGGIRTVFAPTDSEVFSISRNGKVLGGWGDFGTGTAVATIWNETGAVVYQDTAPGRILSVGPPFAVGERNGHMAFWRFFAGSWIPTEVEDALHVPVDGQLNAVDRDGLGIAGGVKAGGGALAVLLRTGQLRYLDSVLSLPVDTLWAVHGVDADPATQRVAFAVESTSFEAWDVTASFTSDADTQYELVPGPGPVVALPLLFLGMSALRMARRQRAARASNSGFTRLSRWEYFS